MGGSAIDLLRARYRAMLDSPDAAKRLLAGEQLARLADRPQRPDQADDPLPAGDLPEPEGAVDLARLVERVVGPLHERANGSFEGHCAWHGSTSGTCLAVFVGREGDWRWYCRSCKRSGGVVAWVALTQGIPFSVARQQLGLAPRPPGRCWGPRREPSRGVVVPADWRPTAVPLAADWQPGQPIRRGCRP
jgi:hypothetical protein